MVMPGSLTPPPDRRRMSGGSPAWKPEQPKEAIGTMSARDLNRKPLLSVDETAVLLGASRASVYRSIERGDLPIPVFKLNGRLRIARCAVDRLLSGEVSPTCEEGIVKGDKAGERSERTLDDPRRETLAPVTIGTAARLRAACQPQPCQPSSAPTCSAARRSSSSTPSV